MIENLIRHIHAVTGKEPLSVEQLEQFFSVRKLKKKEIILEEERPCDQLFYVGSGCLRLYHLSDKGSEQTVQFALENWWLTDFDAFSSERRASYSIQALEKSEVLLIDRSHYGSLCDQFPLMDRYFRLVYQRAYAASLFRIRYMNDLSKDAFYRMFEERYPDFIQRVPQKILASFMGFTPEYLSELKAKRIY